jgi:hypothetical protein
VYLDVLFGCSLSFGSGGIVVIVEFLDAVCLGPDCGPWCRGVFTPAAYMLLSCILAVDDSRSLRPELVSLI